MRNLLKEIEDGDREEFEYERQSTDMDRINSSSGGALAKSVSVPKK